MTLTWPRISASVIAPSPRDGARWEQAACGAITTAMSETCRVTRENILLSAKGKAIERDTPVADHDEYVSQRANVL